VTTKKLDVTKVFDSLAETITIQAHNITTTDCRADFSQAKAAIEAQGLDPDKELPRLLELVEAKLGRAPICDCGLVMGLAHIESGAVTHMQYLTEEEKRERVLTREAVTVKTISSGRVVNRPVAFN